MEPQSTRNKWCFTQPTISAQILHYQKQPFIFDIESHIYISHISHIYIHMYICISVYMYLCTYMYIYGVVLKWEVPQIILIRQ